MANLYERIEGLCRKNHTNITLMCKESGASRASLSDLKMGRKQNLSADTLSKIASYFNVTVDFLIGNKTEEKNAPASEDDVKVALFGGSDKVSDEDWKQVMDFVEFIKSKKGKNDRN